MTLSAGALWGVRPGGDDLNGCYFYDEIPGTSVDYTDQDAAQVDRTNLTTSGAGATTLTDGDAGGLFTTAMPGNGVYIASGTNFTVGMYYIKTRTDANNVVLDRTPTPGGAGASGAGKIGGSRATLLDAFFEGVLAGDTIWVMDGTYTLTEQITVAKVGTAALTIKVYGYLATRGDQPVDDDRPYIVCTTAYSIILPAYWVFEHIRMLGGFTEVLELGDYCVARNLKVQNDSVTGGRNAINASGTAVEVIDCECTCDNGPALRLGADSTALYNECHDSNNGILIDAAGASAHNNLCYDNLSGIWTNFADTIIHNNTLDGNSVKGIGLNADSDGASVINNILSNNGIGVRADAAKESQYLDFNDFWANTTDVTNVTKGPNTLAVDPDYVNRAVKNFALNPTSALINAGLQLRKGVG